jgi:hypothetical protein
MRGRLINPFLAEIAQLDTVATTADPDDVGPLVSGYDPDFKRRSFRLPSWCVSMRARRSRHPASCQVSHCL